MDAKNVTQVAEFVFSGLTSRHQLSMFLFVFFLLVYLVTVVGNVGLMVIVRVATNLHTPMYFFLSYLSAVDLLYSSSVTPKMLADLISIKKTISFNGCAFQIIVFATLAGTEVLLLSSMSYDRYAAVCHPLHYVSIMTTRKCSSMVILSFFFGFFQSLVQTSCIFSFHFCGPNLIDHFYCDFVPLLQLTCSNSQLCSMFTIFLIGFYCLFSLSVILVTYTLILLAIFRIKSHEGRRKAFSTCSSHLMCSSIFYVAVLFTYVRSPSSIMEKKDKVASVFYAVVTPMINPLIYSLRNQEVKRASVQIIHNISSLK
ncbi:olfactory receptor 5AP2-like [Hyperolius riggenbachi]|uniref:olfactory receptor 5AP2-like n=1 Tax=Hyperolius riggenbachi TaxID=752182 RepID=UPI0035A2C2D1